MVQLDCKQERRPDIVQTTIVKSAFKPAQSVKTRKLKEFQSVNIQYVLY